MNKVKSLVMIKLLSNVIVKKIVLEPKLIKAIHNSGWLIFDKLIRMFLGLLVGAWIARYLGPEQYGELAYVLAYLAFFQAVSLLGLDGIVVRDLSINRENAGGILGTAFILRLYTGCVCLIVVSLSIGITDGWTSLSFQLTILAGFSLIFQSADVIDLWFQSQSQSKRTVIVKLVTYLISNGIKVGLILLNFPLIAFAIVMAVEFGLAALGLWWAYKLYPCDQNWKYLSIRAKSLLKESWPFILSGLSVMVYMRIDQIMIKSMLDSKLLGIFSAVLPFSMCFSFIPMVLYTSFLPYISNLKKTNEFKYEKCIENAICFFCFLGWLISFLILISSKIVIGLFLGSSYFDGISVLCIYGFTNLFICLGVAQGFWIINEKKSKITLYRTLFGAAICIFLNLVLIPKYGLVGAAITAVISQFSSTVILNYLLARKIFICQIKSLFSFGLYSMVSK